MPTSDSQQANPSTPWLRYVVAALIVLAVAAYTYGIVSGHIVADRRLDTNTIVLILLAGGAAFLLIHPAGIDALSSVTLGSFKAEFARLSNRQDDQQRQVDSMSAVLALLLTDEEQRLLLRLNRGDTAGYQGSHELRTTLRKLRGMRLLAMHVDTDGNMKAVAEMTDGIAIDLVNYLELTALGARIVKELERIDTERKNPTQVNTGPPAAN